MSHPRPIGEPMTKYSETQTYEPYSTTDKVFMKREGDPCRHCLRPMLDHHNGRCPIEDDDGEA